MTTEFRGSTNQEGLRVTVDVDRVLRGSYSRTDGPLVVGWYGYPMLEERYIGKCKCGRPVSALITGRVETRSEHRYGRTVTRTWTSPMVYTDTAGAEAWSQHLECPACGSRVAVKKVNGKVSPDHACDARCTGATGPNCECQCGGANHGAAHAA